MGEISTPREGGLTPSRSKRARSEPSSPASLSVVLPAEDAELLPASEIRTRGDAAIARVDTLLSWRRRLHALGAEAPDAAEAVARSARELERLGDVLSAAWDGALAVQVGHLMETTDRGDLDAVFEGLGPILSEVSRHAEALAEVGAPRDLLQEVCGPRLRPLLATAFARFDATDRPSTADEVDSLLSSLADAGLEGAVVPRDIVHFAAEALLRAEPPSPEVGEVPATYDSYLALRQGEQRTSLAVALVAVAERLVRDGTLPADPGGILTLVGAIEPAVQGRILRTDLSRVERALSRLEAFWESHPEDAPPKERLRAVVKSRFFHLAIEDDALTRFALELDLLGRLFPAAASRVAPLSTRLDKLKDECMKEVLALVRALSDASFEEASRPSGP